MRTFQMHLLEADKVFFEGECESLVVPTTVGQYGILAGHSNMISAVVPGVLSYRAPGKEWRTAAVSEGMVKVEGNDILVLVDSAEYPEEIDAKRAQRAADEAKEAILQKRSVREYRTGEPCPRHQPPARQEKREIRRQKPHRISKYAKSVPSIRDAFCIFHTKGLLFS